MERHSPFEDFDNEDVYRVARKRALLPETRNFAVEFGISQARIAFNLGEDDLRDFVTSEVRLETPIKWINIWGPHQQKKLVEILGAKYKFTPRLLAVIGTTPPAARSAPVDEKSFKHHRTKYFEKDDVESSTQTSQIDSPVNALDNTSHYGIAKQMVHYQSVDFRSHFLCIGANWLHENTTADNREMDEDNLVDEGKQRPLWCWLILCDDNTVISLHEDVGHLNNPDDLLKLRKNTYNVMSQLSCHGHLSVDPISMQTVRQGLELGAEEDVGTEGASNLFYYLFDDWRAVYSTIATFRKRLENLEGEILGDMTRKSNQSPNIKIIPRLHILGRQVRQMQHLYEGYKNLTERVLAIQTVRVRQEGATTPRSMSISEIINTSRGVVLAQSASARFERLRDRLKLLILSETQEFLAEKEALINTYFNINAQKDSEAAGRLTRSATLLAKLSVLFLPVSFMTSYFSVQIEELNHYTARDYWYAFAVIMSLSILALFFFARLLIDITDWLDARVKNVSSWFRDFLLRRHTQRRVAR